MAQISDDFVLKRGYIRPTGWVGFVTSNPDADIDEVPNGQLFFLKEGEGEWGGRIFEWTAVDLAYVSKPEGTVVVLGRDGTALIVGQSGDSEEDVEDAGVGPARRGPMRRLRNVGEEIFAVGMGRQVYRRTGPNTWKRMENGLPDKRPLRQVIGFNSIDGFDPADLYAVGWGGEIWHFDQTSWYRLDSPTNVAIFDITCTVTGVSYACGQAGTILRGMGRNWEYIEYEGPERDLRSVAWFMDKLYLADGTALFLLEGDGLTQVDFGVGEVVPSQQVHATEHVMLSLSGKEAFTTRDGVTWTPVPV